MLVPGFARFPPKCALICHTNSHRHFSFESTCDMTLPPPPVQDPTETTTYTKFVVGKYLFCSASPLHQTTVYSSQIRPHDPALYGDPLRRLSLPSDPYTSQSNRTLYLRSAKKRGRRFNLRPQPRTSFLSLSSFSLSFFFLIIFR